MKNSKKIMSGVLALALCASVAAPTFAVDKTVNAENAITEKATKRSIHYVLESPGKIDWGKLTDCGELVLPDYCYTTSWQIVGTCIFLEPGEHYTLEDLVNMGLDLDQNLIEIVEVRIPSILYMSFYSKRGTRLMTKTLLSSNAEITFPYVSGVHAWNVEGHNFKPGDTISLYDLGLKCFWGSHGMKIVDIRPAF